MNKEETQRAFYLVHSNYPDTYRSASDRELKIVLTEWERQFAESDYNTVVAAIEHLISCRQGTFAPNIAEIKEAARKLKNQDEATFNEEWGAVSQAAKNGNYGFAEEYKKLSPKMQAALGYPRRLQELAMMSDERLESARNDLKKAYLAELEREHDKQKMPASVRAFIGETATANKIAPPAVEAAPQEQKKAESTPISPQGAAAQREAIQHQLRQDAQKRAADYERRATEFDRAKAESMAKVRNYQ